MHSDLMPDDIYHTQWYRGNAKADDKDAQKKTPEVVDKEAVLSTSYFDMGIEWFPVRHPKIPFTNPPHYSVSKQGRVCSNSWGKCQPLRSTTKSDVQYAIRVSKHQQAFFNVEEIMAYTFWDQPFDKNVHWIHHKDGVRGNCAWDNLVICDLPQLQELEIARLEKSSPGTKYTVVRNVHDTKTFERYLVSDAGDVYSLMKRKHFRKKVPEGDESQYVRLLPGLGSSNVTKVHAVTIHNVVMQSFNGRCPRGLRVAHRDGNKQNNSLENLQFISLQQMNRQTRKKVNNETQDKPEYKSKQWIKDQLAPVTEETRWKPVGTLPWYGESFSRYEVSDGGHVRDVQKNTLLKLRVLAHCVYARLACDPKEATEGSPVEKPKRYTINVSRLVACAFVEGYSETHNLIKHLNGDTYDNVVQNLQWVSERPRRRKSTPDGSGAT